MQPSCVYTCNFSGRLGNILVETALTFYVADLVGAGKEQCVFNKDYSAKNGIRKYSDANAIPRRIYNYVELNRNILAPVYGNFRPKTEYDSILSKHSVVLNTSGVDICKFLTLRTGVVSELFYDADIYRSIRESCPAYFENESTAVHVRRCDYTVWKWEGHSCLLSQNEVQQQVGSARTQTIVMFSDDIEWCKKNISQPNGKNLLFHETQSACDDLILMSQFRNVLHNRYSSYGNFARKMSQDLQESGRMTW